MLVKFKVTPRHPKSPLPKGIPHGYKLFESMNIPYDIIEGLSHWAPKGHIFSVDPKDMMAVEIKHPGLFEQLSHWAVFGPSDDEEVKVMCHDCGGSICSVSGYEFKEDASLRNYTCQKQPGNVCQYDTL